MTHPFWSYCTIYCINRPDRKDRLEHARKEFLKMGILDIVHFFSAPLDLSSSLESLVTCNTLIMKKETRRGQNKPILIFEDDVIFVPEKVKYLDQLLPYVRDRDTYSRWDILRLGFRKGRFIEHLHGNIYRGSGKGSEALVHSPEFARKFARTEFSNLKGLEQHIDHYFQKVTGRSIMAYQPLFGTGTIGSNIRWNIVGNDRIDKHQASFLKNSLKILAVRLKETHELWEHVKHMNLHQRARFYHDYDKKHDTHIEDKYRVNTLFLNKCLLR